LIPEMLQFWEIIKEEAIWIFKSYTVIIKKGLLEYQMKGMWHTTTATKTHNNHNSKININMMLSITITSWTDQLLQHPMQLVECLLKEGKFQMLETQQIIYLFPDRWDLQRLTDSQMLLMDPKASSLWI